MPLKMSFGPEAAKSIEIGLDDWIELLEIIRFIDSDWRLSVGKSYFGEEDTNRLKIALTNILHFIPTTDLLKEEWWLDTPIACLAYWSGENREQLETIVQLCSKGCFVIQ